MQMKQNKWRKVTCEIQLSDVQVPLYILDETVSVPVTCMVCDFIKM